MSKVYEEYNNKEEYNNELEKRSGLPEGFSCSTVSMSFFPVEKKVEEPYKMDLSLIMLDEPSSSFGAMFTKNSFPGYPVLIGRKALVKDTIKGIIINNKISNVGTQSGYDDAINIIDNIAELTGSSSDHYIPSSTGIIGWQLPVEEIKKALPSLVNRLNKISILPVAKGIMTTDSFPKIRSVNINDGRIIGIAKGAGMIEPNLATMLVFIITDIKIDRDSLRKLLKECVNKSFNRISVDTDQSTSDTVIIISSGKKEGIAEAEFKQGLLSVCSLLAEDVVRNGEGTNHVIKATVEGLESDEIALGAAKAIINSPLVKTAVFGNDPNVGRILCALGKYLGKHNIKLEKDLVSIAIGGVAVFEKGCFCLNKEKEDKLYNYLKQTALNPDGIQNSFPQHNKTADINIIVGNGKGKASALGSDLSYDYIKINAEYRT